MSAGSVVRSRSRGSESRRASMLRSVVESLEGRRMLSLSTMYNALSSATPGAVSMVVDSYGAFGLSRVGRPSQYADYTVGGPGVVSGSALFFVPAGKYLAELDPLSALPDVSFTQQFSQYLESSFELRGNDVRTGTPYAYQVKLTQTLSDPSEAPVPGYVQTTLSQTYEFTNLLGTTTSLDLVRLIRPLAGTAPAPSFGDISGFYNSGRVLSSLSNTGGTPEVGDYLEVRSFGASFVGGAIRTGDLEGLIVSNRGIPVSQYGLEGADPTDPSDVLQVTGSAAMAQQYTTSVPGRATASFTTLTTFGQAIPLSFLASLPDTGLVGRFALESAVYNYDYPRDVNNALIPMTVRVDRYDFDATTTENAIVTLSRSDGGAPVTLTFLGRQAGLDGLMDTEDDVPAQSQVSLTITPVSVVTEPGSFTLTLSNGENDGGLYAPSSAVVNLLPRAGVFSFSAPTYSAGAPGTVTVTINRTGSLNGASSVLFTANTGTAVAGSDYVAVAPTLITFADGETSKTVGVTTLPTNAADVRSVNLTLGAAFPNGGATGELSLIGTGAATLSIAAGDTVAPTVTGLATSAGSRGIDGIRVTFSEAMRVVGDLSAFSLFQRSGEGASGSAKLRAVPLATLSYDSVTRTVLLTPRKTLPFNTNFQLTVRPAQGLTDVAGNPINQDPARGVAAYTAYFARGTRVTYVDRSGDTVRLVGRNATFDLVRSSNGDSATLTLFGEGAGVSVLSATLGARRGVTPSTSLGVVNNASQATLDLGPGVTANVPG